MDYLINECIMGIRCNGASMKIDDLSIDDDQLKYDYICTASLIEIPQGNGRYRISIVNKKRVQGMRVGKWKITQAWIVYNWGDSKAWLRMTDKFGNETEDILACEQRGTGSREGFHVRGLVRSIFVKAQEISSNYASASIYEAVNRFDKRNQLYPVYYQEKFQRVKKDRDKYISFLYDLSKYTNVYLEEYNRLLEMLSECKDEKSKRLLVRVKNECRRYLNGYILDCYDKIR